MTNKARKGLGLKRFLKIGLAIIASFAIVAGVGFFAYWQYLKTTPQYSLALLVDAANRDDSARVAELVDSDAVVENVFPQVLAKAVDLYGRGVSPTLVARAAVVAGPLMPAVKERVRPELPNLIRRETERFSKTPFPLLVLGAWQYLDIQIEGDTAVIKRRDDEKAAEMVMARSGNGWKIVGVHDEKFAGDIAKRIGQEILGVMAGRNGANLNSLTEQLREPIQ